jgi:hypothetical protein
MVGARSLKGDIIIEAQVHNKEPSDTPILFRKIHRVSGVGKRTIQRKVGIDIEAKTQLFQIRVSLGVLTITTYNE